MSLAKNGENFVLAQCVLKSQNGQSEIEDELNEARKKLDSNISDGCGTLFACLRLKNHFEFAVFNDFLDQKKNHPKPCSRLDDVDF